MFIIKICSKIQAIKDFAKLEIPTVLGLNIFFNFRLAGALESLLASKQIIWIFWEGFFAQITVRLTNQYFDIYNNFLGFLFTWINENRLNFLSKIVSVKKSNTTKERSHQKYFKSIFILIFRAFEKLSLNIFSGFIFKCCLPLQIWAKISHQTWVTIYYVIPIYCSLRY